MELETNASKGFSAENTLILQPGAVQDDAVVKIAQTFRSGTNDIDPIDFVEMFLQDENQTDPESLNDVYVLVNIRLVAEQRTSIGSEFSCSVSASHRSQEAAPCDAW
jgi:hypothetical protein